MDSYLEKLEGLETIPEKDVKTICQKVSLAILIGQGNFDGRGKYGHSQSACNCLWRYPWTIL